jgi:bifunctional non-homologous end joining protein LigD
VAEAVEAGHVSVWLEGKKLVGGWSLTRTGHDATSWALVKRKDDHADTGRDITVEAPRSVRTGRTVEEAGAAGAVPAPFARASFLEPMLAAAEHPGATTTGTPMPAQGDGWLFEPKLDGLRCVAVRNGPEVALWSRNRLSFDSRFPAVARALRELAADNFVVDGEIVATVDGRPNFAALQQGRSQDAEYWCFDLMWLLGRDVRHLPIEERKGLLRQAVLEGQCLKVVPSLAGDPRQLLTDACHDGWEGLVAKRAGSTYRSGRSADWRKFKCTSRQEMVIGGFTEPRGARSGFGALLLGYWEGGELRYAGKVGTGFGERTLRELHERLVRLERPSSPFAGGAGEKGAHWAAPELVAEIEFGNWTRDGRLRHPTFLGLRPDKVAGEVHREVSHQMGSEGLGRSGQ